MQVRLTCSMNQQQHRQWYKLYTQRKKGAVPILVCLKQLSVLCLLVLCCLIDRMFLPLCGIVIVIIQGDLIWNYYMIRWRHWKTYRDYIQNEEEVLVTEDRLQYVMPDRTIEYRWNGFTGYQVTKEALYLFHQYEYHLMFPKFWFTNEQDWTALIELASKSVQPRK